MRTGHSGWWRDLPAPCLARQAGLRLLDLPLAGRQRQAGMVLIFCLVIFLPFSLSAQGWSEHRADGLLLRFQEPDRALAGALLGDLIAGRAEIARRLGGVAQVPIAVYLAPSEEVFRALTGGRIPHWGVGCAFPEAGIVVLRKLPGQPDALLLTARHEICHILLHHAVPGRVPVWFNEGVAMWGAQEWRLRQSAEVFYAMFSGGLVPLSEIEDVLSFSSSRAHLAYTESLLAVVYLIHLGGPDAVGRMIADLSSGTPFDVALYRVTGYTPRRFEKMWADYVWGRFSLISLMIAPEALWFYLALLFLAAYVAVRYRNRRTVRRWEDEGPAEVLPLRLRLQVHRREDRL